MLKRINHPHSSSPSREKKQKGISTAKRRRKNKTKINEVSCFIFKFFFPSIDTLGDNNEIFLFPSCPSLIVIFKPRLRYRSAVLISPSSRSIIMNVTLQSLAVENPINTSLFQNVAERECVIAKSDDDRKGAQDNGAVSRFEYYLCVCVCRGVGYYPLTTRLLLCFYPVGKATKEI